MNRIARTFAAVAFATALAACDAQPPSKTPSSTVQDNAPPAASAAASAAAGKGFPGTLSVLTFSEGKPITLLRAGKTVAFGTAAAGDVLARPSSDGQHIALISSPAPQNVTPGDLVVVDVGGDRRVLAHNLPWGAGAAPTWAPDGRTVVHGGIRYSVSGSAPKSAGLGDAPYLTYSVGGGTVAYAKTDQSIGIAAADGSKDRAVDISRLEGCQVTCPFAVQAVSDSGSFVALGMGNTDPGHTTATMLVLDTRTGAPVDLSAYTLLQHVWFTAGGGAVIADGKGLHVVDPTWHVTGTFPAPAAGELFYTA